MGMHFDISANGSGFLETIQEIQIKTRQASAVLKQLSDEFDVSSAEGQIKALNRVLDDMKGGMIRSIEKIKEWQNSAEMAFSTGDLDSFNKINAQIEAEKKNIQDLTQSINSYQMALSSVETMTGFGNTRGAVETTQFYDSQEKYNNAQDLRAKASGLESQIANYDDGSANDNSEELNRLRERLSEVRGELRQVEGEAANAASKLGEKLGGKAAEASTALYELSNKIDEQKNTIKTLSAATGNAAMELAVLKSNAADSSEINEAQIKYDALATSLNNAENEMRNLQAAQADAKSKWNEVSAEVEQHDSVLVKMMGGYDNYNKILTQLPGPIQGVITSLQGMTGAAKAFLATPLGIAIGAIVMALQALKTWFDSSKEGQLAFAEVSGYVGGILDQLKEIIITIGKALYSTFSDPKKALIDYGNALKTNIANRFKAIGDIAKNVGNIFKAVFSRDWDGVKQGYHDLVNSFLQVGTGVENVTDKIADGVRKIGNAAKDANDKAIKAAQIAKSGKMLDIKESKTQQAIAKKQARMSELSKDMYSNDPKKVREATAEYKKLSEEQMKLGQALLNRRIELQEQRMSLTTNSIEDENKLRELQTQRIQKETEHNNRMAMLERRGNRANSLDKSALSSANAAVATQNRNSKANSKVDKLKKEYEEDIIKSDTEFELRRQQNKIDLMEEGAKKTLAQMELDHKKEILALEQEKKDTIKAEIARQKAIFDAKEDEKAASNKQYIKKIFNTDLDDENNTDIDRTAIVKIESQYAQLFDDLKTRQTKTEVEINEMLRQSMLDYLKEFGTFQQQKFAIAEKYNKQIKKLDQTNDAWQIKTLEAQRDKEMSSVTATNLAMNIDWNHTFEGVGNVIKDMAVETMKSIKEYMKTDQFKNLGADEKKAYQDFYKQLRDGAGAQATSPFNLNAWGEIDKLALRYRTAVENQQKATARHTQAVNEYEKALKNLSEATTDTEREIAQAGVDIAASGVKKTATEQKDAEDRTNEAGQDLDDATTRATNGLNQFASVLNDITSGSLYGFVDGITKIITGATEGAAKGISEIGGKIGGIIGAALTLIDTMGDRPAEFTEELFDKIVVAIEQSLSQFPEIFVSVVKGIGGIMAAPFKGLAEMFGMRTLSDETLAEDTERLTAVNEQLAKSIDLLSEKMESASIADSENIYKQQVEDLKKSQANTKELMMRSAAAKDNGFLGFIGKKDSSNYKINQGISYEEWNRVSKIIGRTINNGYDFFNLSSEEMAKVAAQAGDVYAHIKSLADDGYQNAAQYMDEYIEYYKQIEKLQDAYNEKITDTSFESVSDSFKSMLLDMESDTNSFGENFEEILRQAVINGLMADKYNNLLKEWYNNFANAMKSKEGGITNLSESEKDALRMQYNDIVNDAIEERDSLISVLGLNDATYAQKATSGGYETMSEDTGQELNGRFTAIQDSNERIAQSVALSIASMQSLVNNSQNGNTILSNILLQHVISNEYLDDISGYTKELKSFGGKLDSIVKNTSKL